jgi:hypothetical protein
MAVREVAVSAASGALAALKKSSVRRGTGRSVWSDRMIRKLKSGEYRLYSRKKDERTGKRKNLGTFASREQAEKHERAVQYFKHAG